MTDKRYAIMKEISASENTNIFIARTGKEVFDLVMNVKGHPQVVIPLHIVELIEAASWATKRAINNY